jgi:hypothetical protein
MYTLEPESIIFFFEFLIFFFIYYYFFYYFWCDNCISMKCCKHRFSIFPFTYNKHNRMELKFFIHAKERKTSFDSFHQANSCYRLKFQRDCGFFFFFQIRKFSLIFISRQILPNCMVCLMTKRIIQGMLLQNRTTEPAVIRSAQ